MPPPESKPHGDEHLLATSPSGQASAKKRVSRRTRDQLSVPFEEEPLVNFACGHQQAFFSFRVEDRLQTGLVRG